MALYNKPHYPYTYGDEMINDGERLSDYVVEKFKDKEFTHYLTAVVLAVIALGSQAAPSNAIPPDYGEAAATATQGVGQQAVNIGNGQAHAAQQLPAQSQVKPNNPIVQQVPGQQNQCINSFNNIPVNTPQGSVVLNGNQLNGGANSLQQWQEKNKALGISLPNPPSTEIGRKLNTAALLASGLWVCLNGAWGNPIFLGGCLGMLLTAAGKNIFS